MNSYSSDSYENARWVQTITALRGKRAHLRTYIKANGAHNYQVDVVSRDYSYTTNVEKEVRAYEGPVFCVSVPSSYLVVRYGGEIAITGNCQNIPNAENDEYKIRGAFIAAEGNDLIVGDYEQLEMRLLAAAAMEEDMINIFLSGRDIHMGNAALVFGPIYANRHNWHMTYEDVVEAKKIDKKVKNGDLPESAMTERVKLALFSRSAAKVIGFG